MSVSIFKHASRLILLGFFATFPLFSFASDIEVQALFTDAAMLKVEGQSKLIKTGQSFSGVRLVEANSKSALIEINGELIRLGMSERISGRYEAPAEIQVRIPRNSQMQYHTQAEINGRRVEVLVDTGANVVAMNSVQARSLGVKYEDGKVARVATAAGVVEARMVSLDSVDLGGIRVNNVRATVIEGDHPSTLLLGMSFLKHVDLMETNGVLLLTRGF